MKSHHISIVGGIFLVIMFNNLVYGAEATVPKDYIGHWRGTFCKGKVKQRGRVGPAVVDKDIGHDVEKFEFDIANDGTVSGYGIASYWFNISAPVNLIVTNVNPEAHLEGKIRKINFVIGGVAKDNGVSLWLKNPQQLPLINAGKKQNLETWNVFSKNLAKLSRDKNTLYLGWSGTIEGLGMELEWRAVKSGLVIYDIILLSPDNSFISTDELKFRAKVEGTPQLDHSINWKSEDGKVSSIESGTLKPHEVLANPDYPDAPPLKPNPPPAPNGRSGTLSYKIIAYLLSEGNKEQTSVLIWQDELDQLRQEYVDLNKNRIPDRKEFTQEYPSLNMGDYSWAIVNPKIIEGYRVITETFSPYRITMNCAYRNPVHNAAIPDSAKESRHIYGDALDLQIVSIGHKGSPNYEDWKVLADAARDAKPTFIEPYSQSKAGHVHADWR